MELGFVFTDKQNRPYYCRTWEDETWLFYWHPDKKWVSLRQVTEEEKDKFPRNVSAQLQQAFLDNCREDR